MSHLIHTRHPLVVTAGLLALVGLAPGCGGNSPVEPSPPRSPSPTLAITALSETVGSSAGGAEVKIEGTGFLDAEGGAVVIFGGTWALRVSHVGTTAIFAVVPPHAAGPVDLVVANPDGQTARLANAYTYAPPASFDPNGEWEGATQTEGALFRFTIQNGMLTAVSCATSGTLSVSPAPAVSNGEFAFARQDGLAITGRLVSPRRAIGTINLAVCPHAEWFATKQP